MRKHTFTEASVDQIAKEKLAADALKEMMDEPSLKHAFNIVLDGVTYTVMHTRYLEADVTISLILGNKDEHAPVVFCTIQEGWLGESVVREKIRTDRARLS